MSDASLSAFLGSTQVSSLKHVTGTILQICVADDRLDDALLKLQDNNIHSLPCWDKEKGEYCGILSVLDIASFFAHKCNKDVSSEKMEAFTVRDVLKWRAGEYFLPVPEDTSVKDAITILFNLHRVPLVNPETNTLTGMLSQSDLVRYVASLPADFENWEALKKKTLEELGLVRGESDTCQVKSSQTVQEALKVLSDRNINAVAVTDADGTLLQDFSAANLRKISLIIPSSCQKLFEPVGDLMATAEPIPAAPPTATLAEILALLSTSGVYRIWIINSEGKPSSVVTLTDILHLIQGLVDEP